MNTNWEQRRNNVIGSDGGCHCFGLPLLYDIIIQDKDNRGKEKHGKHNRSIDNGIA
jgi:hypothetical protein